MADWLAHRMGATLTPAAAASKKRAMQELKDQRALGGKEANQSMATWQQTAPHLRGPAPLTNPAGAAGWRTASLRTQTGAGERTSPLPLPPASNPGTTYHPLEDAEPYTPSGREYAVPCPGPVRVLYTCVPHPHAQMNTHVRSYVHDHGPKPAQLTADWFTLRMSTTHTPPRRNGPCRKDQHALGGKDSYQSISA